MKNQKSIYQRRILVAFFVLLFLILAPAIVFYATGNILGEGWNILATGGVYINSMESGAKLYVNGKLKETTSFFTRGYLLKNIKPGVYTVLVEKDGYNNWTNKIMVYANRVSESNVFMLPAEITISEIKKYLESENMLSTTTKPTLKPNPDYEMVKNFFSDTLILGKSVSIVSTTTGKVINYSLGTKENPIKNRHLTIWKEGKDVFIGWTGSVYSTPKIFCEESEGGVECQSQLKVYSFESNVASLDFFPGESEVIIVAVSNKIFAVEAENNPEKKLQMIYEGNKPDFRILNNNIYINDGEFFGQVEI